MVIFIGGIFGTAISIIIPTLFYWNIVKWELFLFEKVILSIILFEKRPSFWSI
jgi:hypothetical protein